MKEVVQKWGMMSIIWFVSVFDAISFVIVICLH